MRRRYVERIPEVVTDDGRELLKLLLALFPLGNIPADDDKSTFAVDVVASDVNLDGKRTPVLAPVPALLRYLVALFHLLPAVSSGGRLSQVVEVPNLHIGECCCIVTGLLTEPRIRV